MPVPYQTVCKGLAINIQAGSNRINTALLN